jgi:signal transduction histidine kinase
MPPSKSPPGFSVHPSVIFRLGEELITDEVMALVELIKNSYDADASYVKVTINTARPCDVGGSAYRGAIGFITVEDDGFGMSETVIRRGWLTISDSGKHDLKTRRKTTPGGRTPIGDKGLGRLGAQRLGDNIEIITRLDGEKGTHHVAFCWGDFRNASSLESVPVHFQEATIARKKGTLLIISGLRSPKRWLGGGAAEVQTKLSELISPYAPPKAFRVLVELDGRKVALEEFASRLLDAAQVRYDLDFDGKRLRVDGRVKLEFLKPGTKKKTALFRRLTDDDSGDKLWRFLSERPDVKQYNFRRSKDPGWYLDYFREYPLSDIDKHLEVDSRPVSPGQFSGQVFAVKWNAASDAEAAVFDTRAALAHALKGTSGVRIYRDGFGVRVDWDWLELGKEWTSGPSWYGLKPDSTVGHIDISARDNRDLIETTDREGFVRNAQYDAFEKLTDEFTKFTAFAQEALRRGWNDYARINALESAAVTAADTPDRVSSDIVKLMDAAGELIEPVAELGSELAEELESISAALPRSPGDLADAQRASRQLSALADRIVPLRKRTESVLTKAVDYLNEMKSLATKSVVIREHLAVVDEQLSEMYETVALGLTAEALSHEIYQVADRLADRSAAVSKHLRKRGPDDSVLVGFVEHVNSSVIALRKQISYLQPALRYVREKRDRIAVSEFLKDFTSFHSERLEPKGILIEERIRPADDFAIRMNKGKLTQVLGNLILNSEYWLSEDIRLKRVRDARIHIEAKAPFIRIWDNGRGIDPAIESVLFRPFVTTKGRGKGRGLGLFIARQLLDADGCEITVLEKRNQQGHLYIFELNLRGVLVE